MLYLIQDIEAYKYIGVVRQRFKIEFFDDLPIEHSFVGNVLCLQDFPIIPIDIAQDFPHGDEFLFESRSPFDGEVLEELLDSGFLLLVHEGIVFHQGTKILKVTEEGICIHHVLVGIIEITQQEFSPKIEIIQGFGTLGVEAEYLV